MTRPVAAQIVGLVSVLLGVTIAGGWIALLIALGVLVFAYGVLVEYLTVAEHVDSYEVDE